MVVFPVTLFGYVGDVYRERAADGVARLIDDEMRDIRLPLPLLPSCAPFLSSRISLGP